MLGHPGPPIRKCVERVGVDQVREPDGVTRTPGDHLAVAVPALPGERNREAQIPHDPLAPPAEVPWEQGWPRSLRIPPFRRALTGRRTRRAGIRRGDRSNEPGDDRQTERPSHPWPIHESSFY